jgi:hypothetical protein
MFWNEKTNNVYLDLIINMETDRYQKNITWILKLCHTFFIFRINNNLWHTFYQFKHILFSS